MNEEIVELQGFITFYKYENLQTGYKIALFKIDDNSQERIITIVGYFPKFNKDDNLLVKGKFVTHKIYGLQLEVEEIFQQLPNTEAMIIRYLSSSLFPRVGKKCAKKIFEMLKEETISILINQPTIYDVLLEQKIITEIQKESLQLGLKKYDFSSSAVQLLLKNGLSLKNIMKIESVYKDSLQKVLDHNPYQIVLDIEGIGFKTMDKLALNIGILQNDKRRIKAAIIYVVNQICYSSGDTYTFLDKIYIFLKKLIEIDYENFMLCLDELKGEMLIVQDEEKFYHYKLFNAENSIANRLQKYIKRHIETIPYEDFLKYIKNIEDEDLIAYSQEQINALYDALHNGLYIITGGPGTGKTTILNALIKLFKLIYSDKVNISLCAPTGRASKRMSILTNYYACTIHRLLKWDLHSNSFAINENNPLKTDILIIDEFSMVDTLLFDALLKGIIDVSQIIIIGDDKQLPSVGAGNLLYDLLNVENISKGRLNEIFRQSNGSGIIELAHKIRNQQLNNEFKFENDVHFYQIYSTKASALICKTIFQAFESGLTFDDLQVIIPMYAGVSGIDNINKAIQDMFNPAAEDKPEIRVGHQIIRLYDRVLQLKNQPDDDVFNGDIGNVINVDLDEDEVVVDFYGNEVIYSKQQLVNLTLAYAISVHKSQGSEFGCVILCAFKDYGHMLNKPLIYTGVSRAKKQLIIFGDYNTFMYTSNLEEKNIRKTTLTFKIRKLLEK